MKSTPLVSIQCLVYNHEPYLRECLEGFVMQQTNFPFEAIVHDDASTDNSASIIREYAEKYPHIIKPIYQTENQYSKKDGSIGRAIRAAMSPESRYLALCEGDDYWTDPLKLQKQVDFMNTHSECSMCFHSYKRVFVAHEYKDSYFIAKNEVYDCNALFNKLFPQTATRLFRREVLTSEVSKRAQPLLKYGAGDVVSLMVALVSGKVYGMSDIMSVYRKHSGGVSFAWKKSVTSLERMCDLSLSIPGVFGEQFKKVFLRGACNGYKQCAYVSIRQGKFKQALRYMRKIVTTTTSPLMLIELIGSELALVIKKTPKKLYGLLFFHLRRKKNLTFSTLHMMQRLLAFFLVNPLQF